MEHFLSPTGVASMFILAFVIDYLSIGPNSLRDKIAFLIAMPMVRQGFNGGPLDAWTVEALSGAIGTLKSAAGGSYIAGAVTEITLSVLVACMAIYAVGVLLPSKASAKLGAFASMSFPASAQFRINWRLWILAFLIGMMADLPGGLVGDLLRGAIDGLTKIVSWLPGFLFGVA